MPPSTADGQATTIQNLIPQFKFDALLNQDQAGRRVALLGKIGSESAIVLIERAAFAADASYLSHLTPSLCDVKVLGSNDIYSWLLASIGGQPPGDGQNTLPPDVKVNVIFPCTDKHVAKYSAQGMRMVTETPDIYNNYVRPYMRASRDEGRLNWVFNIIEGRKEQEDVIFRESAKLVNEQNEGFLLLPDLNWDRRTISSLHLLAIVERRDIWSLRDLSKSHISWLKHMRRNLLDATTSLYPEVDDDQLKLYVHYHPTYYHFHIHVVHVMLESGPTQAVGKAIGFESLIAQLETMAGENAGFKDVTLTYHVGEASDIWAQIFSPLKLKAG